MPSYRKTVKVAGKTGQELFDRLNGEIERFLAKTSLGNFEVQRAPEKKQFSIESKMFSATLECRDGELDLNGNLSLFAVPFRAKIDEGIDKWISKSFGVRRDSSTG